MPIFQFCIYLLFFFHCFFFLPVNDVQSWDNSLIPTLSKAYNSSEAKSTLTNQLDNKLAIKLIQPDSASQITTFIPTFIWHALNINKPIEYRLMIAKIDGKIIFDQWVGEDTTYTISTPNYFEDLHPYYWTIYASYGDQQAQSQVWSFWVDQDVVTDLSISKIFLEEERSNWDPGDEVKIRAIIHNSGPINADGCFVTLYSGNINRNYFHYAAFRKTIALDTVFISELKMNKPKSITLIGKLPYGYNHFLVRVDPAPGLKDVIYSNNFIQGIKIQTEDQFLTLKGLFIIYKNYLDPETGERRLNENDLNMLYQNILNFQRYFWDHTYMLKIHVDTLHVDRLLSDNNFTYQDDKWGYFLSSDEVSTDLIRRNITEIDHDFMFVYYSWWNSKDSWSGYTGYTFKEIKLLNKKLSFLAQPVTSEQIEDEKTAIHEFLHLLDHLFEVVGDHQFYSPHHRSLYTTFDKNDDYYEWLLETWPANKWFNLKIGQFVNQKDEDWHSKPTNISAEPKMMILSQNYPNPFNKMTTIIYKIPQPAQPLNNVEVSLVIYDLSGKPIRTLENGMQNPGTYRVYWNGKDQNGNKIASGIYFYELKAGKQRQIKKLVYIQ